MSQEALLQELEETHSRLQTALLAQLERQNQRLRLRLVEAENRKLRLLVQPAPQSAPSRALASPVARSEGFSLCRYDDLVRVRPGLKATFAPRINGACRTMAQILSDGRKAQAARERAFCKPKGINSIMKDGDFTTGRLIRYGRLSAQTGEMDWYATVDQTARFKKVGGEWISEVAEVAEGLVIEEVSQFGEG